MGVQPVFALLLLGHVLGDFYFQSDKLNRYKRRKCAALCLHGLIYAACIAAALIIGVKNLQDLASPLILISVSHIAVDFAKVKGVIKVKPFIADQLIHLAFLFMAWYIWGRFMVVRGFVELKPDYLPHSVTVVVLGLLILLRPVGLLISSGDIWDFSKNKETPDEAQKGAGKMTGYLERTIVYLLLLCGQYGAVAFVIAAKSVLRFPEISSEKGNKRALAEYYLIGTLMSMTSVFVTAMLLGLIGI